MTPSLRSLQAFEAAARTGSFAAAAGELAVTPAAVSQLVRGLETQLGRQLFRRANRGIALTEAGREVLPRLSAAFEEISGVAQQLSGSPRRARLTVSVPPSMATGWLPPRLAAFLDRHGSMDIALRGDEDPVDFDNDRIDVRLTYGPFHYPAHAAETVTEDSVYPVCSPEFLRRYGPIRSAADLSSVRLIHTEWGPAAAIFPTWGSFLETTEGQSSRALEGGIVANASHTAIELAANGLGVALGQGIFVANALDQGRLVRPLKRSMPLSQPYCLTIRQGSTLRPEVQAFRDWILTESRHCVASISDRP